MTLIAEPTSPLMPPVLPRLGEAEVQRANALIGTERDFTFLWAGKPARFRFTEVSLAPASNGSLRVRLGDHRFEVGLPALPEPASLGATFAGIELCALPTELVAGVLEAWLDDAIRVLKQHSLSLELEGWEDEQRAVAWSYGWEIAWDGQDRFLTGTLAGSAEALSFLVGLAHRAKPQLRNDADDMRFACTVAVADVQLPLATVRGLACGDVVLVPVSAAERESGYRQLWVAGRAMAQARQDGPVVKIFSMNATTEMKSPGLPAGEVRVDDLPVQLLFDVGQIDVSVAQLRTLREGYTFELPGAVTPLVTIRANGREVGQGELVEVGDKLGVRIVAWAVS